MTTELITNLGQEAIKTTLMLAAPVLVVSLIVGLIVSVFQAVTQINEATLTFVPKIIAVAVVLLLAGPWMLDLMTKFTVNLYENIAFYIR